MTASESESESPGGLFQGWIVVGATTVVMTTAYGAQFSFGVFLPYIEADTGWDRELISRAFAIYICLYAFLSIVSGPLTDRLGPRPVIAAGGVLLGAGYWLLGRVDAQWELFAVLAVVLAAGMSAAFVPCSATVVRWFVRQRGRAVGITTAGASLGNMLAPPLAATLITAVGWRESFGWIGLGVAVTIVLASVLTVRDPADRGLLPDGDTKADLVAEQAINGGGQIWTLADARRTRAFWILTAILFLTWLVVFLPAVHLASFAIDMGMSAMSAAWVLSAIGVGGIIGRPLVGAVSDRVGRLPALGFVLAAQVFVFALLPATDSWWMLCLEAFGFGFGYGGTTTLFPAIVGDYYGRESVGAIVGFVFAIAGSSAAFGPWLAAYLYTQSGNYDMAFWIGAVMNGLALVLVLALKRPEAHA
ncbi:MAG: MFS transporter [Rhodospirillales bacterium]|nr:MFS transporter [Rhodospirillales bacterium]